MKISTKSKNAVAILSYMICFSEKRLISLEEIESRLKISAGYSAQILSLLKKEDIVLSKMGVGGGYYINKEIIDDLTIGDICLITEENMHIVKCAFDENGCDLGKNIYECPCRDMLCDISDFIFEVLDSILLKDIAKNLINNTNFIDLEGFKNEVIGKKQIWDSWID